MNTKCCRKCKQLLPDNLTVFDKLPGKTSRTAGVCRGCRRKYKREYYHKNKKACRRRQDMWEAAQPMEYHERRALKRRLLDKDLTPETYYKIYRAQDGRCAVCGITEEQNGKKLAIDHCHRSGVVRGLLCAKCNWIAGLMEDSPEIALSMLQYLVAAKYMRKIYLSGNDPLQVWLG